MNKNRLRTIRRNKARSEGKVASSVSLNIPGLRREWKDETDESGIPKYSSQLI